jgi:L-lactate utilization protein LutB
MTPREQRNALLAQKMIKNLQRRHFDAYFCKTSEDAINKVKEIIPEGSSISWGGSMTIRDMGLTTFLKKGNYDVYDREDVNTEEDKVRIYRKAFECDFYLSSVNAISEDGVIVNIDGNGNRVAAITWGPKHVIFIVGMNKVCQDVNAALARARSEASPVNAARFDINTPCHVDGVCHNCNSPQSICNYIHFLRNSHPAKRHIVILVDENMGY